MFHISFKETLTLIHNRLYFYYGLTIPKFLRYYYFLNTQFRRVSNYLFKPNLRNFI